MKKNFIAGLTVGLTMLSNLTFADISGEYVQSVLKNHNHWPLLAICTSSDVNVRTEPNTNCDIITMFNHGDKFYVTDVIFKDDYTWMKGLAYTGFGVYKEGYIVSKYLDQGPRASTPSERFRAAFNTALNYDLDAIAKTSDVHFQYDPSLVQTVEHEVFSYAPHMIKVGPHWVHGEKFSDGSFHIIGVVLTAPGYKIAGLEVGQTVTEEDMNNFNKNMNFISWDGDKYEEDGWKHYNWYLDDTVDGHPRPVEGFKVSLKDNVIQEMRFYHIPIN